jgi:hypothetical protein
MRGRENKRDKVTRIGKASIEAVFPIRRCGCYFQLQLGMKFWPEVVSCFC